MLLLPWEGVVHPYFCVFPELLRLVYGDGEPDGTGRRKDSVPVCKSFVILGVVHHDKGVDET
jgi:hypothetical protein